MVPWFQKLVQVVSLEMQNLYLVVLKLIMSVSISSGQIRMFQIGIPKLMFIFGFQKVGDGFKVAVFYYFVIAFLPCTSLAASNFLAFVRIICKCFFLIFLHNWSTYLRCIRNVNELVSLFTLVVIVLSVAEIGCCSAGRF